MEDTNNQTPTKLDTRNTKLIFIVIGIVLVVLISFIASTQRIRLQNQAASITPNPAPPVRACKLLQGTCTLDLTELRGQIPEAILQDIAANGILVIKKNGVEEKRGGKGEMSISFNGINNTEYTCELKRFMGEGIDYGDFGPELVCPIPVSGQGNCEQITPVIISPTPESCKDCVDGTFSCSKYDAESEQDSEQNKEQPSTTNGSCPAFSVHTITYTPYAGVCPTPAVQLNCNEHVVVIETTPEFTKRILSHSECELLKANNFNLKLHTGLRGEGCLNYEIKAYVKKAPLASQPILGQENQPNYDMPLKVCEGCELKSGCPTACAEKNIRVDKLIDIPDIKPDSGECVETGEMKIRPCYLEVGGVCGIHGTEATFKVCAVSNRAKLWFDDPFNGRTWVTIDFSKDKNNDNCVDANEWPEILKYAYNNAGYYDTVLECTNQDTTPPQYFHCAKRITRTCQSGGGPGTPTPTPPVCTPGVTCSPAPSPTPASCPVLDVKLHLSCCSPTPIRKLPAEPIIK